MRPMEAEGRVSSYSKLRSYTADRVARSISFVFEKILADLESLPANEKITLGAKRKGPYQAVTYSPSQLIAILRTAQPELERMEDIKRLMNITYNPKKGTRGITRQEKSAIFRDNQVISKHPAGQLLRHVHRDLYDSTMNSLDRDWESYVSDRIKDGSFMQKPDGETLEDFVTDMIKQRGTLVSDSKAKSLSHFFTGKSEKPTWELNEKGKHEKAAKSLLSVGINEEEAEQIYDDAYAWADDYLDVAFDEFVADNEKIKGDYREKVENDLSTIDPLYSYESKDKWQKAMSNPDKESQKMIEKAYEKIKNMILDATHRFIKDESRDLKEKEEQSEKREKIELEIEELRTQLGNLDIGSENNDDLEELEELDLNEVKKIINSLI